MARNRLPCLATQWLHPVRTAIGLHPIINRLLKVISHTHLHTLNLYTPLHTHIPPDLRHTTPSHFTYSLTKPPMHANTPYLSQFKIDTETERDVHEWFKYHQEFIKQSAKFFIFRNEHQKCCWLEVPVQCVYKGDEA